MSETECDKCGEQPYVAQTTGSYEDHTDLDEEPDVEIWCECPESVPIVFDGSDMFRCGEPDNWGTAGSRFACYVCGEVPEMEKSVRGESSRIVYYFSCMCDISVGFTLRAVMPDKWKDSMDITKWPDMSDEIIDSVEEHGPISTEDLSQFVDLPDDGIKCIVIRLLREEELFSHPDGMVMTTDQVIDGRYDMTKNGRIKKMDQSSDDNRGMLSRLFGWGDS